MRVRRPKGRGRQGNSAPPPVDSWPPRARTTRPPPCGRRGAASGDQGTPPSPPSPSPWADGGRPERRWPRTPLGGALHPGGGHHSRGKCSRAPSAPGRPPAHSRITRCRPATERRDPGMRTNRPTLVPARATRGSALGRGDLSPPPPPATLTHQRPTGPRPAPTAARQPRLHVYTPGGRAGDEG